MNSRTHLKASLAAVVLLPASTALGPVASAEDQLRGHRLPPHREIRSIDGSGNNLLNPRWATAGAQLLRGESGAFYDDGIAEMGGVGRPGARAVSNALFTQEKLTPNSRGVSDFIWAWGQFIDHDLDLTPGGAEHAPIAVPTGDPFFDPFGSGTQIIPFDRAVFDPATGISDPREQVNEISGFLDGSMIYGSDSVRARWLRTGKGGALKVTETPVGDLMPYNDGTMPNAGSPEVPDLSSEFFVAGDIRANEQPVLAILHTLFVREHNRLASSLRRADPRQSDEELYQHARRIVIGEIQRITYEEFLPVLVGPKAVRRYRGYDPDVNPGIATVFSTAAFRLGHTLLSPSLLRLNEDGSPVPEGPVSLRDMFFSATPPHLESEGLEPLLRGLAAQRAQELDSQFIDDVRNFLFGPPGAGGLDLTALNIQRGRDMGLPDFNSVREDYGLPRKRSFRAISSDSATERALRELYTVVDDIDLFSGLIVEDDDRGAMVGETMRAILVDQFERTRDGDRFWYERYLNGEDLARVKRTSLADVIRRNTRIRDIQDDVFHVRSQRGRFH